MSLKNIQLLRTCATDRGIDRSCISGYGPPPFLTYRTPLLRSPRYPKRPCVMAPVPPSLRGVPYPRTGGYGPPVRGGYGVPVPPPNGGSHIPHELRGPVPPPSGTKKKRWRVKGRGNTNRGTVESPHGVTPGRKSHALVSWLCLPLITILWDRIRPLCKIGFGPVRKSPR